MGNVGARAGRGQYRFGGTHAYMVSDLLIDLQLRRCTSKFNIPPCYGEHRTNREKRLSEPAHEP